MSLKPRERAKPRTEIFPYLFSLLRPPDQPTSLPPSVAGQVSRVVRVAEGPYFAQGALREGRGEEKGD